MADQQIEQREVHPLRQIVAIGGASFLAPYEDMPLYRYLLALTGKERPRVCFLPQASGESLDYTVNFFTTFSMLPCQPSHLSLFAPPTADLRSLLLDQDLIYVGGGNTKSMLALWREWRLDTILRAAWEQGTVLAGLSAGSICWFAQGITDSIPGPLTPLNCLGFLPGTNCPHYSSEEKRRPSFHQLLAEGEIAPGYAADDGVALYFADESLARVVATRRNARAYRLALHEGVVQETPLEPELLTE